MNVLIIGSGGREYSIGLALSKDSKVSKIYFAPGNGMSDTLGENVSVKDYHELAAFAEAKNIDLTIVGPEAPLVDGVVDIFEAAGLEKPDISILSDEFMEEIKGMEHKSLALELLKEYCFNHLNLHQLFCNIESSNTLSLTLFKKTGFTIVGLKKDWNIAPGKGVWADEYFLQLINE